MSLLLGTLFFVIAMFLAKDAEHKIAAGIAIFLAGLCFSYIWPEIKYWRKKWTKQ